ncbi:MAG: hypothetical protein WBP38_04635 [Hyphomicrobium sp.]|nr:hypothetical protein [Hyphomicrobium sp.]
MTPRIFTTLSVLALAAVAGGCAADGSSALSTASVASDKTAQAQRIDPACVSLSNQIETLRTEGAVERLEKAAAGKSSSVQVKRSSLAKQAELNKAYADFQAKCGPKIPGAQTAQATVPAVNQVAPVAAAATTTKSDQVKAAATAAAQTAVQTTPKN